MFGIDAGVANLGRTWENRENRKYQDRINAENRDRQDRSIQIKTADAKAAGIHPLYALGSPALGATSVAAEQNLNVSTPDIGRTVEKMGQKPQSDALLTAQTQGVKFDNAKKVLELQKSQMELDSMKKMSQQSPRETPLPTHEIELNKQKSGTLVAPGGGKFSMKPGRTSTESWEDSYGDVVSWLVGMGYLLEDAQYTAQKYFNDKMSKTIHKNYKGK